jgi:hypothetical protein
MEKMHRLILAAVLLAGGCQNVVGPFARRTPQRVDDPLLPISEQRRLSREQLALPDENTNLAPQAPARPGLSFDKSPTPGR